MKDGLEEFLKRIEAKPTNETLIDRFITLVLEEEVLERLLYLKKLVGLLLTPNPYAALKAAALELQEARKEKLTKEYEIGALKDVESCFLKLEKMENVRLIREEINKVHSEMLRESTASRQRMSPPLRIPIADMEQDSDENIPPSRQARVHIRLPNTEADDDIGEHTLRRIPVESGNPPPPLRPNSVQAFASPETVESLSESDLNADIFGYNPRAKAKAPEAPSVRKEFYDNSLDQLDDEPVSNRQSTLFQVPGLNVGRNLLEDPEDRSEADPSRHAPQTFNSDDVFANKQPIHGDQADRSSNVSIHYRPKGVQAAKAAEESASSDYIDDGITSNALFTESQHVHFPDNNLDRGMTAQEMRRFALNENSSPKGKASTPAEATSLLAESPQIADAGMFEGEETGKIELDDIMPLSRSTEPSFPPRELARPAYEALSQNPEAAPPAKASAAGKEAAKNLMDPFDSVRDKNLDIFAVQRQPNAPMNDPFAVLRSPSPLGRDAVPLEKILVDPLATPRAVPPAEPRQTKRDAFVALPDLNPDVQDPFAVARDYASPQKETFPLSKESASARSSPPANFPSPRSLPQNEPRWNMLRDRLRLLSGSQISRAHAADFVLRMLGEHSNRKEQQEVLSILLRVLDGSRQVAAEQRFLAFLFEELHPRALHQLLAALKMGDQTVVFFVDYLHSLVKERQLRRTLNVIHVVIVPGLDLSWYQEAYRFLLLIWPELGLKAWHWQDDEGPEVFCERLSEREDLLPATLLA